MVWQLDMHSQMRWQLPQGESSLANHQTAPEIVATKIFLQWITTWASILSILGIIQVTTLSSSDTPEEYPTKNTLLPALHCFPYPLLLLPPLPGCKINRPTMFVRLVSTVCACARFWETVLNSLLFENCVKFYTAILYGPLWEHAIASEISSDRILKLSTNHQNGSPGRVETLAFSSCWWPWRGKISLQWRQCRKQGCLFSYLLAMQELLVPNSALRYGPSLKNRLTKILDNFPCDLIAWIWFKKMAGQFLSKLAAIT